MWIIWKEKNKYAIGYINPFNGEKTAITYEEDLDEAMETCSYLNGGVL